MPSFQIQESTTPEIQELCSSEQFNPINFYPSCEILTAWAEMLTGSIY